MSISDWPIEERPREKLSAKGALSLSDAELLAIFIGSGTKGKTAVDVARDLLQHFGGLRKLLEADQQQLCSFKGLGKTKYIVLQASLELSRRYLRMALIDRDVVANIEVAKMYLSSCLRNQEREVFACLFLDNKNHVICYEELFFGTINKAAVYPREVAKKALQYNASAIILAHNHTSGSTHPSLADREITAQMKDILATLEIRVLDHIIVGIDHCASFSELGML